MTKARNPKKCITQADLKKMLHYNPETGIFTRTSTTSSRAKKGMIAGCECKTNKYILIFIYPNQYKAHRLAWLHMTGEWPECVDHINHVKKDNRWCNLRRVTKQENEKNMPLRSDNKTGIHGVRWNKINKNWRSTITSNLKIISLGSHADKFEAICARKSAENKYRFHENHGASI